MRGTRISEEDSTDNVDVWVAHYLRMPVNTTLPERLDRALLAKPHTPRFLIYVEAVSTCQVLGLLHYH